MQGFRGRCEPRSGQPGSAPAPHRQNRLSRSFRQTQTQVLTQNQTQNQIQASPRSHTSDFKSPTKIPRSRGPGSIGESPHNDSDIQQDIIWDATSPTPQRLGKRGKKHPAGVVDISEIVSRIAPEHGRPKVTEPTLQQWIGDSAAIPCTPDVHVPRTKKKSPRLNAVDDLLKLAKQFDFNMFHQDEDDEEEELQRSPELLLDDVFDDGVPLPGTRQQAVVAADPQMDDDLDFLFDGPTQRVSGDLSQFSSSLPSRGKRVASAVNTPEKPRPPLLSSRTGVSATRRRVAVEDKLEDDWENDDLLNDSLVFEMTQNPMKFIAPRFCSTQTPEHNRLSPPAPPPAGTRGGGAAFSRSAASEEEKENVRATFKLASNPNFSGERFRSNSNLKSPSGQRSAPTQKDSSSAETGSQRTRQTNMDPPFRHQASAAKAKPPAFTGKNTRGTTEKTSPAAIADTDFLDKDLDFFFSSDPVWDDPADDDLLCEMCDDLEDELRRAEGVPAAQARLTPAPLSANRQPAPGKRGGASAQKPPPLTCGSGGVVGGVTGRVTGGVTGRVTAGVTAGVTGGVVGVEKDSFRFTRSANLSGVCRSQSAAAAPLPSHRPQFTFKKPNNPVSTVTNTAALSKCSAAEIELKKQQAMERRRQRLQAVQNLQAPT